MYSVEFKVFNIVKSGLMSKAEIDGKLSKKSGAKIPPLLIHGGDR
jgi:hypothetical protein